ncbi:major facilitator superfamily domain-containing protein [Aspergillus pseudotamarii]|uniref:Major facilitator superfamily domain-containing protein n=1 Tax=Aspergillus pseudotamarii TaxID=132259 RepID=A0A5N6SY49_ASPPS|nr:major facilitator superfamily domain-containing protein [Aspergillus pseudotamarii]KAE8138709.1 major facilitator superfamily domain-containing protein [Aspergillus pseudotamarii]
MDTITEMADEAKVSGANHEANKQHKLTLEKEGHGCSNLSPPPSSASATCHHSNSRSSWGSEQFSQDKCGQYPDARVEGTLPREDHGPYEVSFDGDQDPMCPRSMPLVRKWVIVLIVCTGTLCVTCTSSIYTTTYTQMNPEFHTSTLISTIGLSSFVLGIGTGPLLTGPLSEHYGRRPIYLVAWTMFLVWTIPSAVAKNIQTIIVSRFFNGFTGGTFLSVAGGTAGDVFSRNQIQAPMALVSSVPFIGPSLGPVLGGFINSHLDWRWTYYIMIIWSAVLLICMIFFAPETYHPIILRARARALRQETGNERYRAPMEDNTKTWRQIIIVALLRPFQLLFLEPMCLCLDIYSAILLGILYLFFGTFPMVFRTTYDMNLWQGGLTFVGIIVGMVIVAATTPIWSNIRERLLNNNAKEPGRSEPEYRLPPAIVGGILIPLGLFWFGWTTYSSIHWIVPIIGSAVFGGGLLLAFTGIFTFLVDAYPQYAASALAANGFARCTFAAAFPLFGSQMYDKLGYQWATSLLAFLTVAMMPFPWLFFKYGKALRAKSKFALPD